MKWSGEANGLWINYETEKNYIRIVFKKEQMKGFRSQFNPTKRSSSFSSSFFPPRPSLLSCYNVFQMLSWAPSSRDTGERSRLGSLSPLVLSGDSVSHNPRNHPNWNGQWNQKENNSKGVKKINSTLLRNPWECMLILYYYREDEDSAGNRWDLSDFLWYPELKTEKITEGGNTQVK